MSDPELCHCGHPVKGHIGAVGYRGCWHLTPMPVIMHRCPCRCTPAEAAEPGRTDCPAHLPAEPGA
jgi:hypothetical protein